MSERDQLADVIEDAIDSVHDMDVTHRDYANAAADAVLGMIKPLVEALRQCEAEIDGYIKQEYPHDHPAQERCRQRDFAANPARIALTKARGDE